MPFASLAIVACIFGTLVGGHEHHMNLIADGAGVSDDPIVSEGFRDEDMPGPANSHVGHHTMDTHSSPDSSLGDTVPHWHGIRGMAC